MVVYVTEHTNASVLYFPCAHPAVLLERNLDSRHICTINIHTKLGRVSVQFEASLVGFLCLIPLRYNWWWILTCRKALVVPDPATEKAEHTKYPASSF